MGDSKSETKQFPMVSHKAPLSVLGPLISIVYVNPHRVRLKKKAT